MLISVKTHEITDSQNGMKGLSTVSFGDAFKVRSIAVMEGKEGKPFVAMPSYKSKETDENGKPVYKEICNPITKDFRETLYNAILDSLMSGQEVTLGAKDGKTQPDYGIKAVAFESDGAAKGLARLYLDDSFVINNVAIKESKSGDLFMSMPSYKTNQVDENGKAVYKDICYPATKEFRAELQDAIVKAYQEVKNPGKEKENDNPFVEGKEPKEVKTSSPKESKKQEDKSIIKDRIADGNTKKQTKAAAPKEKKAEKMEPVMA